MKNLYPFRVKKKSDDTEHLCEIEQDEGSQSFLKPLPKNASRCQKFYRLLVKSRYISDKNPLSIEYFQSNAEILRLRKEHVVSGSIIIHPFSSFRAYYEVWLTLIFLIMLIYMPFDAAFNIYLQNSMRNIPNKFRPMNFVMNSLCWIDILMTFFTGFVSKDEKKVIMKPGKIAQNYIFGVLFVSDVLSSIPEPFFIKNRDTQRIVAALGLLKITRLPTLFRYTSRSGEFLKWHNATILIAKNIVLICIVFHWNACLQYLVPQIRELVYGKFARYSWVEVSSFQSESVACKYFSVLFRASGYILCVNFETINLQVWEEKILATLTRLIGKIFIFYITVVILHQLLSNRCLEIKYFGIISQVKSYMRQKHLPMHMQVRLLQFYRYKYNNRYFKEANITSLLSEKLKGEINVDVCSKLVQNVNLFSQLPLKHLQQIVTNLKAEIYLPNDIIIKAGSVGDCMYFLASGTVAVWTPSGKEICHLQDGAYFGEISLVFRDKKRTANIVAIEICEVYKLSRKLFKSCFKANAEVYRNLEEVASERLEITKMYEEVHTRAFMEQGSN